MVKRELATSGKGHYILPVCNMPKSLLVFAVSFTPETPNFLTFGGVAHPPRGTLKFLFLTVYMHIFSNLNYKKYLDIKKNRIWAFQDTDRTPLNISSSANILLKAIYLTHFLKKKKILESSFPYLTKK